MAEKILSVIIPCYNQGIYVKDALNSLRGLDQAITEVIIVNDGSTDKYTNDILLELSKEGWQVIFQENKGLGGARNAGILSATGKYILPLDADNTITERYVQAGIEIMDRDPEVAVVYGNAEYFGDKKGALRPGPFNLQRMMCGNYIDACAVIRRSVLEEVGLYDNMKIMGLEDWDLWLRIAFNGHRFYYLDETVFGYRVLATSMMNTLNADIARRNQIEAYFAEKYKDKLDPEFIENMITYRMKKKPVNFFYRLLMKKFFPEKLEKKIRENKMYRGHFYGRT